MNDEIVDFVLEHYGKKGMRWGVRKKVVRESGDYKQSKPYRGKPVKSLTNKQLKDVNNRLNLEQNYKRLNPSTIEKGHKAVKQITAASAAIATIYGVSKAGPAAKFLFNTPQGKSLANNGRRIMEAASKLVVKRSKSGQLTLF